MFALKKIISSFVTLPGLVIVALVIIMFQSLRDKKPWKSLFIIALMLYIVSTNAAADIIIGSVEERHIYRGDPSASMIILLGGGAVQGVDDISGKSIPCAEMLVRIVDAARLYKKYGLPVLFTGGTLYGKTDEADIVRRFLVDLGVSSEKIIVERRSRDTVENAEYVKSILKKLNVKKTVLLTSAYHIRRACLIFSAAGIDFVPHSAGAFHENEKCLSYLDFLPDFDSLRISSIALRESAGFLFYYMKYRII